MYGATARTQLTGWRARSPRNWALRSRELTPDEVAQGGVACPDQWPNESDARDSGSDESAFAAPRKPKIRFLPFTSSNEAGRDD
jgi:hypothetical protein